MTKTPSPYTGNTIVFATMHGKENLAAPGFAERLGAIVIAPDRLDTDQLGTWRIQPVNATLGGLSWSDSS